MKSCSEWYLHYSVYFSMGNSSIVVREKSGLPRLENILKNSQRLHNRSGRVVTGAVSGNLCKEDRKWSGGALQLHTFSIFNCIINFSWNNPALQVAGPLAFELRHCVLWAIGTLCTVRLSDERFQWFRSSLISFMYKISSFLTIFKNSQKIKYWTTPHHSKFLHFIGWGWGRIQKKIVSG